MKIAVLIAAVFILLALVATGLDNTRYSRLRDCQMSGYDRSCVRYYAR